MAWTACSFCRRRFLGKGITAYHRWWLGEKGMAWKQKACPKCALTKFDFVFKSSVESSDEDAEVPTNCTNCGGSLTGAPNVVYHSFFQGLSRRDLVAVMCDDDLELATRLMMEGGEELEERGASAGGSGGARSRGVDILADLGRL